MHGHTADKGARPCPAHSAGPAHLRYLLTNSSITSTIQFIHQILEIMAIIKVSLSFHRTKPADIDTMATNVKENIFLHSTIFLAPPVPAAMFEAQLADHAIKRALYKGGGINQKGAYLASVAVLMNTLDLTAEYVDTVAQGDPNIITMAGFKPTKGNASKMTKPGKAVDVSIRRSDTGVLRTECDTLPGAETYTCVLTMGYPLPSDAIINEAGQLTLNNIRPATPEGSTEPMPAVILIDFKRARRKKFIGLTVGRLYYAHFFGENAGGVGLMSDPVSMVCY
jgi:hypothetical protein